MAKRAPKKRRRGGGEEVKCLSVIIVLDGTRQTSALATVLGCFVRYVTQVLNNSLAGVEWLQVKPPYYCITETLVAVQVDTLGKKVLVGIAFGYLGLILFLPTLNIFYQVRATSTPSLRALRLQRRATRAANPG